MNPCRSRKTIHWNLLTKRFSENIISRTTFCICVKLIAIEGRTYSIFVVSVYSKFYKFQIWKPNLECPLNKLKQHKRCCTFLLHSGELVIFRCFQLSASNYKGVIIAMDMETLSSCSYVFINFDLISYSNVLLNFELRGSLGKFLDIGWTSEVRTSY